MTVEELSNELDIIYENINKGGAPGLTPYEKSVILTASQDKLAESIVDTMPEYVANLIKTYTDIPKGNTTVTRAVTDSLVYKLPNGFLKILSEVIFCRKQNSSLKKDYVVVPISYTQYDALTIKPYKYPARRTVWRLVTSSNTPSHVVEIVLRPEMSVTDMFTYKATFLMLPKPIIVEELDGYTIRGERTKMGASVEDAIHYKLLEFASTLAEQYYMDKAPQQRQEPKQEQE